MTQTKSDILRGYFEEVNNQKRLDLIPNYVSEKFVGHGTPYVGIGLMSDDSKGEKVIVQEVYKGSPAAGKLRVGDELLRVFDGERTWNTFEELRQGIWGQGVIDTPLTVWVRRENMEQEITLTRGLVQGFEFPYRLMESGMRQFFKEWPDYKTHLVNVIESGDLIAYHAENQGHNIRYGRSAVWAEFGMVRIQDGKITDWWSVEDMFSQFKQLGYTIPRAGNGKGLILTPSDFVGFRKDGSTLPTKIGEKAGIHDPGTAHIKNSRHFVARKAFAIATKNVLNYNT